MEDLDGLNIRKAMAILVAGSYVAFIFLTKQDMGLKDITIMVISYYWLCKRTENCNRRTKVKRHSKAVPCIGGGFSFYLERWE